MTVPHKVSWGKAVIFKMPFIVQELWINQSLENLGKDMADAIFLDNSIYLTVQYDWAGLQNRSLSSFRNLIVKAQVFQFLPMADKASLLHLKHEVFVRDVYSEPLVMLNLVCRIFLSTNTDD